MWVVVAVVALVVSVATIVTFVAHRVDRLHGRAAAARLALDAQSERRAQAALELGEREYFDEAVDAAHAVLDAGDDDRAEAENRLTRTLRLAVTKFDAEVLADVVESSRRLALARQLHSDLVRDALASRRRPLVRLLRLGRRQSAPQFFDIDDPALDLGR
jgi:hypothetical protein